MPVWNRAKKEEYFERVEEMLGAYNKVLVVGVSCGVPYRSSRRGAESKGLFEWIGEWMAPAKRVDIHNFQPP